MTMTTMRRCLLACALVLGFAAGANAQQPAPAKPQGFPTAEAAADALTAAVRSGDRAAIARLWGNDWRDFVPLNDEEMQRRRNSYIAAWDAGHKIVSSGDSKATIEIGRAGWTLPIPLVKDGAEWRFDIASGLKEIALRRIGYNELSVVQTLLAIVDAQHDYANLDPMKIGVATYARRLLSSPGKKDGLYWEASPGEPQSPLGALVAKAQPATDLAKATSATTSACSTARVRPPKGAPTTTSSTTAWSAASASSPGRSVTAKPAS